MGETLPVRVKKVPGQLERVKQTIERVDGVRYQTDFYSTRVLL